MVSIPSIRVRASSTCSTGVFAAPLRVLRPTYRVRRIGGQDLADDQPVKEHPQGGQVLLDRRFGLSLQLQLDEGRHMDRLDLGEIHDAVLGAEGGELPDRLHVGVSGVGIADVRAEEVAHSRARFCPHREDRGQGSIGSYTSKDGSHHFGFLKSAVFRDANHRAVMLASIALNSFASSSCAF